MRRVGAVCVFSRFLRIVYDLVKCAHTIAIVAAAIVAMFGTIITVKINMVLG